MSEARCPKCGAFLEEPTTTITGRKLQRCSQRYWDIDSKKNIGCDYVKWLKTPPEIIEEKCPKCGMPLVIAFTRFGKKMKKCSTNIWNPDLKKAVGCDFVEWVNGTTEELDEECPNCNNKLMLYITAKGKKMKKCSTSGWDSKEHKPTGCPYIEWLKPVST